MTQGDERKRNAPNRSHDIDRALSAENDGGWTGSANPDYVLTDDAFEAMAEFFDPVPPERRVELKNALKRIYRSLVNTWQQGTQTGDDGTDPASKNIPKPTTLVAKDLKKLGSAVEKFVNTLDSMHDYTNSYIDLWLEKGAWGDNTELKIDSEIFRSQLQYALTTLSFITRDANGLTKPGPHNAALHEMVEGLANWWEEIHGKLPVSDKARGNRADPFLDLCLEMVTHAQVELSLIETLQDKVRLSGLVYEVLKTMKSQRD